MIFSSNCRNKRFQYTDRWEKLFGSSNKNNLRTYDNIRKLTRGQGDSYTAGCLPDYHYFRDN